MRNKHPGYCYRCGEWVKPGAGHFERISGGWRVQHADCAIEARKVVAYVGQLVEAFLRTQPIIHPCVCGYKPVLKYSYDKRGELQASFWLACLTPGCGKSLGQYMTPEKAIERWNFWYPIKGGNHARNNSPSHAPRL